MSNLSQTSKRHVHSKQFSTKWVTDIFQEGWPAVCQNGTLKRQTDYLFMCWFGGCFCHLFHFKCQSAASGLCQNAPRGEVVTALTDWDDPSLAQALSCKLFWNRFMNVEQAQGKEWVSGSCHPPGSVGRRKKAEHLLWAEVGGHVWWWTSESQKSERER